MSSLLTDEYLEEARLATREQMLEMARGGDPAFSAIFKDMDVQEIQDIVSSKEKWKKAVQDGIDNIKNGHKEMLRNGAAYGEI